MADNFTSNPGSGGVTFASDDILGIQYPRAKMVWGADGVVNDVSAAAPMPVTMLNTLALTDTQLRAAAVPVSISGVASETTLAALNTKMPAQGQALMAVSSPIVIASNQSAIPVTGTFFQATQAVSAAALPLPTGASTETTLAALNTKVTAVNTGAVVLATGAATIGAVNQGTANAAAWLANPLTSQITAEASSAKIATGNSAATIVNASSTGVMLFLNASVVSGTTPSLTVRVQVLDPVSGGWVDLPGASYAAVVAVTAVPLLLVIGLGVVAVANAAVNMPLPRSWRLAWVISGTTPSFTFSVGAQYLV